ncbi:MAG: 5-methyltetrahydrofolate--homocysteine methyltransferase [Bacteroidaceae bacterium]|nr:5-methyltetrahydrofolate--homocysteine methyltransferase [Bacteroidaceae bacterium]
MKRDVFHYTISEVAPYIDWSYLLHAWGVTGKKHAGEDIIAEAKSILHNVGKKYRTHAIFALCEAKGADDDIIVEGIAIPCLRQQHAIDGKPNLCLSDFVSPHGDKIGLFATTIDSNFGAEYKDDPYMFLLAQTLADRLAEATASLMHKQVRTKEELWGYALHENLSIAELLQEKNQGIRPAVGYPSLPDQSIIFEINRLLHLNEIDITLTPNGAMTPHASVCGMMIAHPQACYFSIGKITEEQLSDYAQRRKTATAELRKFLSKNIE